MTDTEIESDRAAPVPAGSYDVGYGRPPIKHRFRKGQSGNPAGRPRRATGAPGDRLPGADEPTRSMILEEAYRLVTVRDGEEEVELSLHRAVFRAMAAAAMNGSQSAQHRLTRLIQAAEAERKREQVALYNALEREGRARDWDDAAGEMRVRASYADDIVVDEQTGRAVVRDMGVEGDGGGLE